MNKFRCVSRVSAVAAAVGMAAAVSVPAYAADSAADYYAKVIRKNDAAESKAVVELYNEMCSTSSAASVDGSETVSVYVEPGAMIGSLFGIKEGTKIGLVGTANSSGDNASADYSIRVNSKELAKLSAVLTDEKIYCSVPTLSSAWISATPDEFMEVLSSQLEGVGEAYGAGDISANVTASVSTGGIPEFFNGKVITKDRVDRIVNTYTDIYLKYADDVKIKNNVEVTAGGLKASYTRATVELSGTDIYNIALDVVNTAAKDADLKAIWKSLGMTSEDYSGLFKDAKSSLKESKAEFKDMSVTIEQYFSKKGEMMGQKMSVKSASDPSASSESYMMTIEDGSKTAVEGSSKAPTFSYSYSASGTESASGKSDIKGKVTVNVQETDYNGEVQTVKQKYNFSFSGDDTTGTFKMNGTLTDTEKFTLTMKAKDTVNTAKLVVYSNNQVLVTVTATEKQGKAKAVTVPSDNVYSIASEEEQAAYAATLDPTALVTNIEAARGDLGDALTDSLLETVGSYFAPAEAAE